MAGNNITPFAKNTKTVSDLGFDFDDDQHDYGDGSSIAIETHSTDATAVPSQLNSDEKPETMGSDLETPMDTVDNGEDDVMDPVYTAIPISQDPDQLQDKTPEGFSADSLLQAMSEEASAADDMEDDLMMTDSLSPLERITMYNEGNMIMRATLAKELPNTLYEISLADAVYRVLPVILTWCSDPDDGVRETFVRELDKIILFYYHYAPPLPDAVRHGHSKKLKNVDALTQQNKTQVDPDASDTVAVPAPIEDDSIKRSSCQSTEDMHVDLATQPESFISESDLDDASPPPMTESTNQDNQEPHIPPHAFTQLLIDLMLDQNTNLASLTQQCIVSITSDLASSPTTLRLLDSEIFNGVVMGLMSMIDTDMPTTADHEKSNGIKNEGDLNESNQHTFGFIRRRSSLPEFETTFTVQPSRTEDIDQSEINLAKVMSLSLISALASILGPERCTKSCLPIIERLALDQMFYVRKEAATAIGNLASVVEQQVTLERLLPLYRQFTHDNIWHIRRSCVLALPMLCAVIPNDDKTRLAVESVEQFKNDSSRNVRNSLAEIIGELISKFLPNDWEETGKPGKVPEPLLDFFLSLSSNTSANQMLKLESDRSIICAYNFPAVVLTAGADYWDTRFKDTYLNLTKDYQIKVRRTFAYSLHEIARIIGPDRTERDLVQIFALYLMDLDDVKEGVLEHLAEFLGTLAESSRNEYIPILAEVWDGVMNNWRLRDTLASQLQEISLLFDAARVVEHVLPLAIRACQDDFAAVRETGVDTFPVILSIVRRAVEENGEALTPPGDDDDDDDNEENTIENKKEFAIALHKHVVERLDDFVLSDSYRGRIVFAHICQSLIEAGISAEDFATYFLYRIVALVSDSVVNVRIATARALRSIYKDDAFHMELSEMKIPNGEGGERYASHMEQLEQAMYTLAMDSDMDVRSYVIGLVDGKRLDELKERKQMETQREQPALVDKATLSETSLTQDMETTSTHD